MFVRSKTSRGHQYLQIVENYREEGRTRQRVISTLGRLDRLQESGQLDALLRSAVRFSTKVALLEAYDAGNFPEAQTTRIGPALVFGRLWREAGIQAVLRHLLADRKFGFNVERAIFLTVLHRLFSPGSDRAGEAWRQPYAIAGTEGLDLHQMYRAMGWLGSPLGEAQQAGRTPFAERCTKDRVEEELFAVRRDLFTTLDLVFFDTTSIYFEGEGGETVGQYGNSKDHRPDRKQMVVGVILDDEGRPICCELWPGNTTDVKTLIPIVDRLRERFRIGSICIVADRGMVSQETIAELEGEERNWEYILGARMRKQKEVREEVLSRGGRYQTVHPKGRRAKDPSPLKVKEVRVKGRRYVVCLNEDEAKKDAADREAIVANLLDKLKQGATALVGNKGYRKYLSSEGRGFRVDETKIAADARFDGKWVLRTNTDLSAKDVALKYKQLWMVEQIFRTMKSLLCTRPIFHKCDETIRGHVFCSFLALVLRAELQRRLEAKGWCLEWDDVIRDVDQLEEIELESNGKPFLLRNAAKGCCGKVFQAVGVALPPTIREKEVKEPLIA
ncbi:MAG: IS1634 family transposase [bacterium]